MNIHISDSGHIIFDGVDGGGLDGSDIVLTGSPIGRFIFTAWDSLSVEFREVRNFKLSNMWFDSKQRTLEGRAYPQAVLIS